jgi:hypothetical protein
MYFPNDLNRIIWEEYLIIKIFFEFLVCDLNAFEYPLLPSSHNNVKYLYRFRLDDGTADQNRSFQQFASIYETYIRLVKIKYRFY